MPGVSRYWTPFLGTQNNELVNARAKYLAKPNCRVLDYLTSSSLAFMHRDETLLINAHGQRNSLMLAETANGTGSYLSINNTAAWLRYAGLPRDHVRIKILGCETANFARYFAGEMGKTHPNIVVGGYRQEIYVGSGHRALITTPGNYPAPNTTGSGNVIWYDARGNPVAKPTNKVQELQYDPYLDVD